MGQVTADADETPSEPPPLSREQIRSRRPRDVRAHTVSIKRLTKREIEIGRLLFPPEELGELEELRPKKRADCVNGIRPCPFVSCHHHLYLDVKERTGAIQLNFPDIEPEDMGESCVLDIAESGGVTLEAVGQFMNLTRERVRQIEVRALANVAASKALDEHAPQGATTKRRLPLVTDDEDDEDFDADHFASDALAE